MWPLSRAAAWLDQIGLRDWAAGPAYPTINTLHLLGLVMLVGAIGVVDLRVAGAWPTLPRGALSRALTPVAVAGLGILLPSGVLLFAADGESLASSGMFQAKLALIVLALVNVAAFHWLWRDPGEAVPIAARAMALSSIATWLTIAACGRLIAYS